MLYANNPFTFELSAVARKATAVTLVCTIMVCLFTRPVRAQWAVYDHNQFILQLQRKIEDANRWLETKQKWLDEKTKWLEQLTRLRGILTETEKLVMRNKQNAFNLMIWGQTVRRLFEMRRNIENMIRSRIQLIETLRTSIKQEFFNPENYWNVFTEYLRYNMGRVPEAYFGNLERLARMDAEYDALVTEWKEVCARINSLYQEAEKINQELKNLQPDPQTGNVPESATEARTRRLNEIEKEIAELKARKSELEKRIDEKVQRYGFDLRQSATFGEQINEMVTDMVRGMELSQEVQDKLNRDFFWNKDDEGPGEFGDIYLDGNKP